MTVLLLLAGRSAVAVGSCFRWLVRPDVCLDGPPAVIDVVVVAPGLIAVAAADDVIMCRAADAQKLNRITLQRVGQSNID